MEKIYIDAGFNLLDTQKFNQFLIDQMNLEKLLEYCNNMLEQIEFIESNDIHLKNYKSFISATSSFERNKRWAKNTLTKFRESASLSSEQYEKFIKYLFFWHCLEAPSALFFMKPFLYLTTKEANRIRSVSDFSEKLLNPKTDANDYKSVILNSDFIVSEASEIVFVPKSLLKDIASKLESNISSPTSGLNTLAKYISEAIDNPKKELIAEYLW